jgi:LacI family transcriptional regulator
MKKRYVTIEDIAKKTGKSIATVSRVLNRSDKNGVPISIKTKDHVLSAIKELGYIPNYAARTLSQRNSMAIGLIIPDIMQVYFNELCYFISKQAEKNNYNIILSHSYENSTVEAREIEMLISRRVDGIILAPSMGEKNIEYLETIQKQIPLVLIDRYFPSSDNFYSVTSNDIEGMYLLTKHLLKKGAHRIVFISGTSETSVSKERIEGFTRAYNELGVSMEKSKIIRSSYFQEDGFEITKELITSGEIKSFDAIVGINDYVALGIIDALDKYKIKIPDKILIAGYGNNRYLKYFRTPLTTVDQNVEAISKNAYDIFLKMKKSDKIVNHFHRVPVSLVKRASTGD